MRREDWAAIRSIGETGLVGHQGPLLAQVARLAPGPVRHFAMPQENDATAHLQSPRQVKSAWEVPRVHQLVPPSLRLHSGRSAFRRSFCRSVGACMGAFHDAVARLPTRLATMRGKSRTRAVRRWCECGYPC